MPYNINDSFNNLIHLTLEFLLQSYKRENLRKKILKSIIKLTLA